MKKKSLIKATELAPIHMFFWVALFNFNTFRNFTQKNSKAVQKRKKVGFVVAVLKNHEESPNKSNDKNKRGELGNFDMKSAEEKGRRFRKSIIKLESLEEKLISL